MSESVSIELGCVEEAVGSTRSIEIGGVVLHQCCAKTSGDKTKMMDEIGARGSETRCCGVIASGDELRQARVANGLDGLRNVATRCLDSCCGIKSCNWNG